MYDLQMWNVRDRTKEGMPRTNTKLYGYCTRKFKSCFRDLLISGNSCALWDKNDFYNMGNLSKFKLLNIVRSKIGKVYESLNKRLVFLISKEQEGEIEPLMF